MWVLLGCEESQEVCKAFRDKGHDAYSCDKLYSSGGLPQYHIIGDILPVLKLSHWDRKICFPPCTDLAVSGARWFKEKRESGTQAQSIKFFLDVWENSNAVENQIGIMNTGKYVKEHFPELYQHAQDIGFPWKPTQIIQPWQFGHGETKATCLWLRGLPPLKPTNIVEGREGKVWRMAPSPDRAKLRSKTYPGIAKAMANAWG